MTELFAYAAQHGTVPSLSTRHVHPCRAEPFDDIVTATLTLISFTNHL
jgi:hypothetical protein